MDNSNRLMIRLIDVALIILLGFIAISRLKTEYVDLPAAGSPEPQNRKVHEATLHIYPDHFLLRDGGRKQRLTGIRQLESAVVATRERYARRGEKFLLTITSHNASVMQSLIDVLDICQRHHIEKSMDYDRLD